MSSRRSVRQLLVAVLLGVLVGGGLMAVTPAGAEVAQAAATSWKKIWKKELKPLADKRYYQKSQSDTKYASKAEAAAAAAAAQSAATTAASSATDSKLGGYYKKTESDGRYAQIPALIRGGWAAGGYTGGSGDLESSFGFGVTLTQPPIPHFIPAGAAVPSGCSGSLAAPGADPGHLCVFEQSSSGLEVRYLCNLAGLCNGGVTTYAASVFATDTAGGADRWMRGTWALRPGGVSTVVPTGGLVATTPVPSGVTGPKEAGVRIAP